MEIFHCIEVEENLGNNNTIHVAEENLDGKFVFYRFLWMF